MEKLTGIFDSHAHYDDPAFDGDREQLLDSLAEAGVETVLTIGADLATSRAAVALAERYPFLWAAVGVHPHGAVELPEDWLRQLEEQLSGSRHRLRRQPSDSMRIFCRLWQYVQLCRQRTTYDIAGLIYSDR